ncbi:MAG: hypothetical protein GWP03_00850 [Proteobacteria bacterium]|nr:hypothetical protein [Pseudomonadota bacterium]
MPFPEHLNRKIFVFIPYLFFFIPLFATFKYTSYKNGEIEHFKSNLGNIKIKYIITDSTIEQNIKFGNLTISNLYTYDDNTVYHKSKHIHFLSFKEDLIDKSQSIKLRFPLRDSLSWQGKGIAERKNREIPYTYNSFVKDTIIVSSRKKIRCFKIHSETHLTDGEHSSSIYYFDPASKTFIRVEMNLGVKGVVGNVLRFFKVNKFILYK